MYLEKNAEPKLTCGKRIFKENLEKGMYMGIPSDYFKIKSQDVFLKSELAKEIEWNLDEEFNNYFNINAKAQTVNIDGKHYSINPGYFCSNISKDKVKEY